MTATETERLELSRRSLLKGAGSLVVGFTLARTLGAADPAAAAAGDGLRIDPIVHNSTNDAWLILKPLRTTIYSARVELGTGVITALSQIVLEELRLGADARVDYVQGDTTLTPLALTVGSKSIQDGGPLLRQAAATAFRALLEMAATRLGVPTSALVAENGVFRVPGQPLKRVSYAVLLASADTLLTADPTAPQRPPAEYQVVGQDLRRYELPGKVYANFKYVQDIKLDGMLHGRVVRPTGRNSHFVAITPESLTRAQAITGFVQVVQRSDFVGVVASSEYAAELAADPDTGIVVEWTAGPAIPPQATVDAELRNPANHYLDLVDRNIGNFASAYAGAATQLTAQYFTAYQMHGAMGPSCAVADVKSAPDPVTGVQANIWSSSQIVYFLRGAIANLLFGPGDQAAKVHVQFEESAGCYGHNGADDVAADAALLSQAVGAPVRVQWTRQDEHGWEPLGPAASHDLEAGVTDGQIVAWHHRLYGLNANNRPGGNNGGQLLAGNLVGLLPADLPVTSVNFAGRNQPVTYAFPNQLADTKLIRNFDTEPTNPRRASAPLVHRFLRTTALRSLGGFSNSFANECFLDEVAQAVGRDRLEIRLAGLSTNARATAVLNALQPAWSTRPAGGNGTGAGIAYQQYETLFTYTASYAEVRVDATTGQVRVTKVIVAHDCGLIINPDGLRNQIEGNVIQGISRTLKEEVAYGPVGGSAHVGVTSLLWSQYPVIRFNEVPPIEIILINRPDQPAWGAGEPTIGTIGAAIGNAVFAATGKRVRSLPMTPARVLATPVS
jgi:CO/xanthine dehydrogenase Mo-binding subunit